MKRMRYGLLILFCFCQFSLAESIDRVVAYVNDDIITASELNRQMETTQKQLFNTRQVVPAEQTLRQQVLTRMIETQLQLQVADKMAIQIRDRQVNEAIQSIAKRNQISMNELKSRLLDEGMEFEKYRKEIRQQLLISEVQNRLVASKIIVTPEEVNDFVKAQQSNLRHYQYRLRHVLIPFNEEEPSTDEIQRCKQKSLAIYQQLKKGTDFEKILAKNPLMNDPLEADGKRWHEAMSLPERFVQALSELKKGEYTKPIQTSNGFHILKLVEKQNNYPKHYSQQYHVRQIFMKSDDLTSNQEIKRKLDTIRADLLKGENFSDFAKLTSQDQHSVSKGGDMGWVFVEEVPPKFAEVMEKASINHFIPPFRTELGWHLIQVLGKRRVEDSDRIRQQQARQTLFSQKLDVALQNWLHAIRNQAYVQVVKQ